MVIYRENENQTSFSSQKLLTLQKYPLMTHLLGLTAIHAIRVSCTKQTRLMQAQPVRSYETGHLEIFSLLVTYNYRIWVEIILTKVASIEKEKKK